MHRSMFHTALLALAAGCSPTGGADPRLNEADDPAGTLFLTQASPAGAVMEALFEGRVIRDEQGCLRLETGGGERHTVVWPHGFTLRSRAGALYVHDAEGREIGRVGGPFRFGGGEVPSAEWLDLSAEQRAQAQTRCPGRYWVVGDTDPASGA